jgi:hypothetical protein
MRLQEAVDIYAGGPGSGCQGPNCGRHGIYGNNRYRESTSNVVYMFKKGERSWRSRSGESGVAVALFKAGGGKYKVKEGNGRFETKWSTKSFGSKEKAHQHLRDRFGIVAGEKK